MDDTEGRTVKLFLVNGTPSGIITAEIVNWTGHVTAIPRAMLPVFGKRPEADRTAVYLLLGRDAKSPDLPTAYIGETEEIFTRLKQHGASADKDFFDRVIVVTAKDGALTKAHVKHLEAELHRLALAAGTWRVLGPNPSGAKLPESDVADMDSFLRQVRLVLPVLGVDLLVVPPTWETPANERAEPPLEAMFFLKSKYGVDARAIEVGGEFVVLAGSFATTHQHAANSYASLRGRLIEAGKLEPDAAGLRLRFADDVSFTSPSAASATILNRNDNGRNSWRMANGKSYGSWESTQLGPPSLKLPPLQLEDLDIS